MERPGRRERAADDAEALLEQYPDWDESYTQLAIPQITAFFKGWYEAQNPDARWKDEQPLEFLYGKQWRDLQMIIDDLEKAGDRHLQLTVGGAPLLVYRAGQADYLEEGAVLRLSTTYMRHPYNKDTDMPVPTSLYPLETGYLGDGETHTPLPAFAKTLAGGGQLNLEEESRS